jgi:uncharacterized lipoprotein YddW (UPF0748 family)
VRSCVKKISEQKLLGYKIPKIYFSSCHYVRSMKMIVILLFCFPILLSSEIRAVWLPAWDMTSPELLEEIVESCSKNGINQILAQVRYRGDALYIPNKKDSTFINPEPRSHVLKDSLFDPLAYLIDIASSKNIEVHAWVTVYVFTPRNLKFLPSNHLYRKKPEWITHDIHLKRMHYNSYEGAFLEPGLPEVQDYLYNVLMDIVINYEINGLHLDYIRYPDTDFGYHPQARKLFEQGVQYRDAESWQNWKEEQIGKLIRRIYWQIRKRKPHIAITAAVVADVTKAVNNYGQNWLQWLEDDYIDKVYLMSYSKNTNDILRLAEQFNKTRFRNQIVFGLRAWDDAKKYKGSEITAKIKVIQTLNFSGYALFSSTGIRQNGYFPLPK